MSKQYWFFGTKLTVLADADQTESNFDLIQGNFPPGSRSPMHVHTRYSETFYVLEGEAILIANGQQHLLKAGECYTVPKNVEHAVINNSDHAELKALVVASASGFAKLINTAGIVVTGGEISPPREHDMALVGQAFEEAGDRIIM
jgi:quercetin dioxygenase-like cupin family protein